MKEQKFLSYKEPIFQRPIPAHRIGNGTSMSNKIRKSGIKISRSQHKKTQLNLPINELVDQKQNISFDKEQFETQPEKEKKIRIHMPIQIFLNKNYDLVEQRLSPTKKNPSEKRGITTSQGKRTIIDLNKHSSKNLCTSAMLPSKDIKALRIKNFSASPYLKNLSDVSKIIKMLKPVKGPNESIKKQIIEYNDSNKKNHQLVVLRRPNQKFESKRQTYLERIGLKPDSKVFIMNSRDKHIRRALIQKGWIELNDLSDSFFHLKWVYSDTANDYQNLNRGQLFNHFHNNQELTNKNNLRKNIKATQAMKRPLIPLTFDFGIAQEFKKFVQSATLFQAIKILNLIKIAIQRQEPQMYNRIVKNSNYFRYHSYSKDLGMLKSQERLKFKQCYFFPAQNENQKMEIFSQNLKQLIRYLVQEHQKISNIRYSINIFRKNMKNRSNMLQVFEYFEDLCINNGIQYFLMRVSKFIKVQLIKLYFHFKSSKIIYNPSYGVHNTWIVKPTGVSRGSGIYIQSDYRKLMSQTNNQHGKIVQKYVEKPLLLGDKRKFDLRQWVLVKSFEPLQVYMYKNLYGRICPQRYTQTDFQNIQKHLTNFSLSKDFYKYKNQNFPNLYLPQEDPQLFSNVGVKKILASSIILEKDLEKQINQMNEKNIKWSQIKLEIKKNILLTLKACAGGIVQHQGSFEMYGFDILLDEDFQVFVIEVNLSPACQNREGLSVYLNQMSLGLINLVENWLNLSQVTNQTKQAWQKLEENDINLQLKEIKLQKQRHQKATKIQRWFRSFVKVLQKKFQLIESK